MAYEAIPFTNKFGQVINPGDQVLSIAGSYGGNFKTRPGVYLGRNGQTVKVEIMVNRYVYSEEKRKNVTEAVKRISSLPNGRIFPSQFSESAMNVPRR